MPPAKPAKKSASKYVLRKDGQRTPKPKATCHTCGARIRVPAGWSVGPAVRRHYWAKHRDVMQPTTKKTAR